MIKKNIYTTDHFLIARGYERPVSGERGTYLEFTGDQLILARIIIPWQEEWRITDPDCYYIEFRTKDSTNTKVYYQKKLVKYADYKIGYYYIRADELIIG